jgi:flagellar hook assembly protein FlgD
LYKGGINMAVKSVAALVSSTPNLFEAHWDGRNANGNAMAPGVYFIRITSGSKARTAQVTITK